MGQLLDFRTPPVYWCVFHISNIKFCAWMSSRFKLQVQKDARWFISPKMVSTNSFKFNRNLQFAVSFENPRFNTCSLEKICLKIFLKL